MTIHVVMEPPAGSPDQRMQGAVLVPDRFSWLAFIVPPLWLLWHRLWVEALLALAAMAAIAGIGEYTGSVLAVSLLGFAVPLYAGLEGQGLRIAALRRRGWSEWGVVDADTAADAETRYAFAAGEAGEEVRALPPQRIVPDASLARPAQTGLALGLTHMPGRT